MEFFDLRPYEQIEPMPEVPNMQASGWLLPVWGGTVLISFTVPNPFILVVWIPWFVFWIRFMIHNFRIHRKFNRDLQGWADRAEARHDLVMAQYRQYVMRDWN